MLFVYRNAGAAPNLGRIQRSARLMNGQGDKSEEKGAASVPEHVVIPDATDQNLERRVLVSRRCRVCTGVLEKVGMVFVLLFVCYLSWTIPAHYGLFTSATDSGNETSNSDGKLEIDSMNVTYTWTPQYNTEPTFTQPTKETNAILPSHRKRNKKRRKKQKTRKKNHKNSKHDDATGHDEKNSDEDIDAYSQCKDCKIRKRKGRNKYISEPGVNNISLSTLRKIFENVADNALSGGGTWNSLYGEGSQNFKRHHGHHKTNDLPGKDRKNRLSVATDNTDVQKRKPWVNEASDKNKYSNDEVGPWSEWSPCSVTCGTGQQERARICGPSCKEVESMICMMPCPDGSQGPIDTNSLSEFYVGEGDGFVPPFQAIEEEYLDPEVDNCGKWIDCNKKHVAQYLLKSELPACPCFYPLQHVKNRNLWDSGQRKEFNWIDFSAPNMLTYKPGAKYCIMSKLAQGTKTLAVQQCCYDDSLMLITGGKAAGTPILISPDISEELHWKVDLLPWVICKGDWTRYNQVLPTNNNLRCEINPGEAELHRQVEEAMRY